jgi:PAS domain S-box-containing protein
MKARRKSGAAMAQHTGAGFSLGPAPARSLPRPVGPLSVFDPTAWSLLETAHTAVALIQQGRFCYANRRAEDLLGYTRDELYRMETFLEVVAHASRDSVAGHYEQQLAGVDVPPYECMARRRDGSELILQIAGSLVEYEDRPTVYATLSDVTEERWLREQVVHLEKMATVGQLVCGVAHELNSPLTSVLGFAEWALKHHELSDELRHDLEVIVAEAHRARDIAQNLLAFARSHAPDRSLVSANDLLNLALRIREHDLQSGHIEVVRRLDPTLPPIMADPDQLTQVFLNIIVNAEHAMARAHGRGTLSVTTGVHQRFAAGAASGWVVVSISDDGPGIPPDMLQHIFEPFYTTKEMGKGTGLGLTICENIIKKHKGRIYAENCPGEGAAFVIELPIAADAAFASGS